MKKIILASKSPRRIEMMKDNGFDPAVMPADIDETLPFDMTPEASVMYLALKKAAHVADLYAPDPAAADTYTVIAADTVVVYEGRIIGKPQDAEEAFDILSMLCGKCHHVITGVCIISSNETGVSKKCFYDKTTVFFKDYSDEELARYVETDEPYDKAGGYAIQGTFGKHVHHIEGNLDNVIGFPWKMIRSYL